MKLKKLNILFLTMMGGVLLFSCMGNNKKTDNMNKEYEKGTFGYDLNYLSKKDSLIVLKSEDERAQVIVSAKYQAKVFTSTANGVDGTSLGFVNYKFFDADVIDEHMNGYGGENRFWLGPEGGQYSIYFAPEKEQVHANWHTPKAFDIEEWGIRSSSARSIMLTKEMKLKNYKGNTLDISVDRNISILSDSEIIKTLGITLPEGVSSVGYSTDNKITNKNDYEWTKETGTVCIWMLDMFNPSDSAVTVIPYNSGDVDKMGVVATTDYFGEIPVDRLKEVEGVIYLKTDGKYRSKLGLNGKRTTGTAGNYDPIAQRLTIVTFDVSPQETYLNQEWNPTKDPLKGDALNAYNDGPLEDGSIMGPFLELESCSPAAFLKAGESLSHIHNVFHFVGDEAGLSNISKELLGVNLEQVKNVF